MSFVSLEHLRGDRKVIPGVVVQRLASVVSGQNSDLNVKSHDIVLPSCMISTDTATDVQARVLKV